KELKDYLEQGYYPFSLESASWQEYLQRVNSTIEKTIYLDIARVHQLKTGNLTLLTKILYFLATIPPGTVNTHNLAKHLGVAHETAAEYVEFLRQAGLIRFLLMDARGSKLIRNAAKVFLENPNMLRSITMTLDQPVDIGQIRELFVLNQAQNAGLTVSYSEIGDLRIGKQVFEIGGKNKTWANFKKNPQRYLVLDGITEGEKNVIPLYLFGFLY
ncbi:MAG: ATPase, partial [Candidatus Gracilibacteria bacterium]|nr:ATPase [Candidatus Gracilibacteria bacterium]